jgi:hypothetical protein
LACYLPCNTYMPGFIVPEKVFIPVGFLELLEWMVIRTHGNEHFIRFTRGMSAMVNSIAQPVIKGNPFTFGAQCRRECATVRHRCQHGTQRYGFPPFSFTRYSMRFPNLQRDPKTALPFPTSHKCPKARSGTRPLLVLSYTLP